ncbi:MAG: NUDIX hydrolase, partial [Promethearchaeota archaeon]
MEFVFNEKLIRTKLKDFDSPDRLTMSHEYFINSAIIFLIIPYIDKPYDLVFSGEMSFPGGKFDPSLDASYLDTAFRELDEELGIPQNEVSILGCIDDHLTPKGFIITAYVAFISHDTKMVKQDSEVKEIVKIPITFFANKKKFRERTYKLK